MLRIEKFFQIKERGSSIGTEVRAGLVLFATCCYIVVVNGEILASAGMDIEKVELGTCITTVVTSLLFGIIANIPVCGAPGMGVNSMIAFEMINGHGMTPSQALACCTVAGGLVIAVGAGYLGQDLISRLPGHLKQSLVASIGLFQTLVAFSLLDMLRPAENHMYKLPSNLLGRTDIWIGLGTLMLIAILAHRKIHGGILIALALATILYHVFLSSNASATSNALMEYNLTKDRSLIVFPKISDFSILDQDFSIFSVSKYATLAVLLVFLVILIDSGGVLTGFQSMSGPVTMGNNNNHNIFGNTSTIYVCLGIGIIVSAMTGTSPPLCMLESSAAIHSGGRTGLSAVVGGLLFLIPIFCRSITLMVPKCAIAAILIFIGSLMMKPISGIHWENPLLGLPAFLTLVLVPFTSSISAGVCAGLGCHAFLTAIDFIQEKVQVSKKLKVFSSESDEKNIPLMI